MTGLVAVVGAFVLVGVAQRAVLRRRRPRPRRHLDGARARRAVARVARGLWRGVPAAVGGLVLLVALDWAVGAAWDRVAGDDPPPVSSVRPLATQDLPPAEDPRVDLPALADAPWADRYFAELETLDFTYVPFIGPRETPVQGRYVSSADGIRGSYEPAALPDDAPEVWFFGGSALWGEGQRDAHTIPSEVARLAEAEGRPVRVVNFGVRGYTALQELLVFEQEVERRGAPALAVFYHGFNELSTQVEAPENLSEQPTIFQLATTADAVERAPALPGQVASEVEPSVVQEYRQTSVLTRLGRTVGSLGAITPAAADDRPPFYTPPPAEMAVAVDHAAAIYRRTMAMLAHVAEEHEVPTAVFWQPADRWDPYDELGARVAGVDGGIDVSQALDDPPGPVYLDGVHTNELGARLMAEAMWPTVSTRLAEGAP